MTGHNDLSVLTARSGDQLFGIAIQSVVHVLNKLEIAPVPGTPGAIAGLINLRGHIVVTLDLRAVLGQPKRSDGAAMGVILETPMEQICLMVDSIGEVVDLSPDDQFEPPRHISQKYIELAESFYRQEAEILIRLDEDALLIPESMSA